MATTTNRYRERGDVGFNNGVQGGKEKGLKVETASSGKSSTKEERGKVGPLQKEDDSFLVLCSGGEWLIAPDQLEEQTGRPKKASKDPVEK